MFIKNTFGDNNFKKVKNVKTQYFKKLFLSKNRAFKKYIVYKHVFFKKYRLKKFGFTKNHQLTKLSIKFPTLFCQKTRDIDSRLFRRKAKNLNYGQFFNRTEFFQKIFGFNNN